MRCTENRASRMLAGASLGCALLLTASAFSYAACTNTITLSETTQMNFATIGPTPAGGTVVLKPGGNRTAPTGFFLSGTAAGGAFKASAGTGAANCAVVISFTPGTLIGPGTPMTITSFTDNAGASPKLNSNGVLNFKVGADLLINSNQTGGTYSGTYTVTVIY